MNEFENLSVKFNKETLTLEEIDKKAKELGFNRSKFVVFALQMMINFDPTFWGRIQKYSEGLHIPTWLVIQNMIIKRFAKEAAEYEVWNKRGGTLEEFLTFQEQDGPRTPTGEELFNILKQQYVKEFERKLLNQALTKKANGSHLSPKEEAIIVKYSSMTPIEKYESQKGFEDEYDEDEYVTAEELEEWEKEAQEKWEKEHK